MAGPMERLQGLEMVEKEIITCLHSAGQVLAEMGKDKPSQKQVDTHANHFLKTLNHVELELSNHINYLTQVSTGQAHEGSSYAAQKNLHMAWHRNEHAKSKINELERTKTQVIAAARQGLQQRAQQQAGQQPTTPTTTTSQPPQFPQQTQTSIQAPATQ